MSEWIAIPTPQLFEPTGGAWRPASGSVVAADPMFAREAARLAAELIAYVHADGAGAPVTLVRDPALAGEAYRVSVDGGVRVAAATPAGMFRGTRQLVHNLRAQGSVPCGVAAGAPVVAERGLHLDSARKHYGAAWIGRLLERMAEVGVNVLQWHLSDNEGFRIGSERHPEVVSAAHVPLDAVRELLALAADLHIEVIPAFDMPGHLQHALASHPELALPSDPQRRALNIADRRACEFALDLVDEYARVFHGSRRWMIGADEFVDVGTMHEHPVLGAAVAERFGATANGFDLLTAFAEQVATRVRAHGFVPRVWNDGMFRGEHARLGADVEVAWWTNWHAEMRPLATALASGHPVVNCNDGLFYWVLGENAGYLHPTDERIWAADWHPGLFPALPDGTRQELTRPYPAQLLGAMFSIWADRPDAETADEVLAGIRRPLAAFAERSWNAGSSLPLDRFRRHADAIAPN